MTAKSVLTTALLILSITMSRAQVPNPKFECFNQPRVFISYNQKVEGYSVKVMWFPIGTEVGRAILYFEKADSRFYLYNHHFNDSALYYTRNKTLKDGQTITLDYIAKKDDEYLSRNSPFFFVDVDFDGKKELVINNWRCGSREANSYEVYRVEEYGTELIHEAPFNELENGHVEFDSKQKTITCTFSTGAEFTTKYIYKQKEYQTLRGYNLEKAFRFEMIKAEIIDNGILKYYTEKDGQAIPLGK